MDSLKRDLNLIKRDPMMFLLYMAPLLLNIVFKTIETIMNQYLMDITHYQPYFIGFIISITAGILGSATAFTLMDDKEAKIYDLMQITPIGRTGYFFSRIRIPIFLSVPYILITSLLFGITLNYLLLYLFLTTLNIITFSLVLFSTCEDRMKLLTYAKGLNLILVFSITGLFESQLLTYISYLFPTYWLTTVLVSKTVLTLGITLLIHLIWFLGLYIPFKKGY